MAILLSLPGLWLKCRFDFTRKSEHFVQETSKKIILYILYKSRQIADTYSGNLLIYAGLYGNISPIEQVVSHDFIWAAMNLPYRKQYPKRTVQIQYERKISIGIPVHKEEFPA